MFGIFNRNVGHDSFQIVDFKFLSKLQEIWGVWFGTNDPFDGYDNRILGSDENYLLQCLILLLLLY